jgi:hypothetical protein
VYRSIISAPGERQINAVRCFPVIGNIEGLAVVPHSRERLLHPSNHTHIYWRNICDDSVPCSDPNAQYPDDAEVERETAGADFNFSIFRTRDPAALPADALENCDALLVWHEMVVDRALIARLKRCRIIVRAGAGFDHIELAAAGSAGIPVCNTPDYGTSEVADHAIGLLLALRRGIPQFQDQMRRDIRSPWQYRGSGLKPSKFPEPWEINSLSERDVCQEDIKVDRLAAVAEHVAPEEVDVPPGHGGDFLQ